MRGVTAAGIPVLGIGHNGHLAWGFTSGLSDEDDLYAEKLTGTEAYRYKGASRPMDCRNERFDFKAPATDLPDLVGTPGPAVGLAHRAHLPHACTARSRSARAAPPTRAATPSGAASWRRWSGLSALNDAKTVRQADAALQGVTWNENVMAADERGDIGYWHPGLHPLRPEGLRRAPALPRHRRGRVARPAGPAQDPARDQPAPGLPVQLEQRARPRAGPPATPRPPSAWPAPTTARVCLKLPGRPGGASKPSYAASRAIDRTSGSTAQQRPLFGKRLRLRAQGRRPAARPPCWTRCWAGTATTPAPTPAAPCPPAWPPGRSSRTAPRPSPCSR